MLPQPTGAVEAQEGSRTEDGHHHVILAIPRPFLAQTLEEWFDAPSPVVPSEEEAKISVGAVSAAKRIDSDTARKVFSRTLALRPANSYRLALGAWRPIERVHRTIFHRGEG